MTRIRDEEGRLVLRNAVSIGAFLMSPIQMLLMVRALGTDGYGRWWVAFVLLEAAGILGMVGADLYVRREVSKLEDDAAGEAELVEVVGTSLTIATIAGLAFALVQIALADRIAELRHDPPLASFLAILAFQPLLWNLNGVLGAALQSRRYLGILAVLRGLVTPILQAVGLLVAWRWHLPVTTALAFMLAMSLVSLVLVTVLYASLLPLGRTLLAALRPRRLRPALKNGLRLFVPLVLFTLGGKVDLYVYGAYAAPAAIAIYGACLQVASGVPNTRSLFDPVVQTQIGALTFRDADALTTSMRRLGRMCALALAPAFVVTVAVGAPILGWLVGYRTDLADGPLAIMAVGHLLGCIAVAAWVVPMMLSGRLLSAIAAAAGLVKLGLLLVLVPRFGANGAAIATAVGGIIAWQGQALLGSHYVGCRPYTRSLVPVLVVTLGIGALARALYIALEARMTEVSAVMLAGSISLVAIGLAIVALLEPAERIEIRRLLGLR